MQWWFYGGFMILWLNGGLEWDSNFFDLIFFVLGTGTWLFEFARKSWECHHPNWQIHTFQRSWLGLGMLTEVVWVVLGFCATSVEMNCYNGIGTIWPSCKRCGKPMIASAGVENSCFSDVSQVFAASTYIIVYMYISMLVYLRVSKHNNDLLFEVPMSWCTERCRKESLQLNVVSIYLQFNDEAGGHGTIGFAIETWDSTGDAIGIYYRPLETGMDNI